MNKFVLSLCLAMLLIGCDTADKNKTAKSENNDKSRVNQPTNAAQNYIPSDALTAAKPNQQNGNNQKVIPNSPESEQQASKTQSKPETGPQVTAEPVIDATNEQTMNNSLNQMIAPLSDNEKEEFAEAFLIYTMSKVDMSVNDTTNQKNILQALNGKSVNDILREAAKIVNQSSEGSPFYYQTEQVIAE